MVITSSIRKRERGHPKLTAAQKVVTIIAGEEVVILNVK